LNTKKERERKKRGKSGVKISQSMATASVAGDLGTMDDFEPTSKIPKSLTF
jgi:hypothetical protein